MRSTKELFSKLIGVALNYPKDTWWSEEPKYQGDVDYEGVIDFDPMLAKEYLNEESLNDMLNDPNVIEEEKLDGVRARIQFFADGCRVFGRNISKTTGYRSEFTDLVPHIRDLVIPELENTIIDGEFIVPNKPFKTASAILNCLPEEAIRRQKEEGLLRLTAFDLVYHKGDCKKDYELWKRKKILHEVCETINKHDKGYCVKEGKYFNLTTIVEVTPKLADMFVKGNISEEAYPNLNRVLKLAYHLAGDTLKKFKGMNITLTKREYYEYIVALGGEGVVLKDTSQPYVYKRGRQYTKWKKYFTRDCILINFTAPTRLYGGKELDNPEGVWEYWEDPKKRKRYANMSLSMGAAKKKGLVPVTKAYALGWVGNLRFGVIVTPEDKKEIAKTKNGKESLKNDLYDVNGYEVLCVGECTGLKDEERAFFTESRQDLYGRVVEIKGYDMFKDTGKMRHPSFLRLRDDKNMEQCTWEEHIL